MCSVALLDLQSDDESMVGDADADCGRYQRSVEVLQHPRPRPPVEDGSRSPEARAVAAARRG